MSLPWFRMYTGAVDDEKLRLLAFEDRWHFVALCCCMGAGVIDDSPLVRRKLAVKLGLGLQEFDEAIRRLAEVGLVDRETFKPLAWEKRQFASDSSAERTARYRKRKAQNVTVTSQERPSDLLDTDTDTDTEESTAIAAPPVDNSNHKAKRKTAIPQGFAISDRVRGWAKEKGVSRLEAHLEAFVGRCQAKGYQYVDWDAAFMTAIRDDWAKLGSQPASPAVDATQAYLKSQEMTPEERARAAEARRRAMAALKVVA